MNPVSLTNDLNLITKWKRANSDMELRADFPITAPCSRVLVSTVLTILRDHLSKLNQSTHLWKAFITCLLHIKNNVNFEILRSPSQVNLLTSVIEKKRTGPTKNEWSPLSIKFVKIEDQTGETTRKSIIRRMSPCHRALTYLPVLTKIQCPSREVLLLKRTVDTAMKIMMKKAISWYDHVDVT